MVHWIWLIIAALALASFGGIIMALFALVRREDTPPVAIEVVITEDVRAEKTGVEFEGDVGDDVIATQFVREVLPPTRSAMPFGLGLALSDLLTQFATALGHQTVYHPPKEEERSLKRTHRLDVFNN